MVKLPVISRPVAVPVMANMVEGGVTPFLAAPELAIGSFASEVASFAVVSTEEAFVTRPMDAEEARARVAGAGIESATLYPVLEVGE